MKARADLPADLVPPILPSWLTTSPVRRAPIKRPVVIQFLDEPEPCRECGEPCLTRTIGGKVPMHISCDNRTDKREPADLAKAIVALVEAFPMVRMDPPAPPVRPRDVGPCTRCRLPTRRYGDYGGALCPGCQSAAIHV